MPKKDIHPEYNEVTIVMSDGSEFVTRSTMKTKDGTYRAQVDSKNHPFYKENLQMVTATCRVDKFNKRYGKKS